MMKNLFDLSGKVALITGGTHGIGLAIAKILGNSGARICINDLDEDKLEACKKELLLEGIDAFTLVFDVTDEQEVDKGISMIEEAHGPIDILVNNAGIIKRIPILDMDVADFRSVIDVDLVAPLIVAKRVAPAMIANRNGKIINMCSMMSVYGRNSVSAYAEGIVFLPTLPLKEDLNCLQQICAASGQNTTCRLMESDRVILQLSKLPQFVKVSTHSMIWL